MGRMELLRMALNRLKLEANLEEAWRESASSPLRICVRNSFVGHQDAISAILRQRSSFALSLVLFLSP